MKTDTFEIHSLRIPHTLEEYIEGYFETLRPTTKIKWSNTWNRWSAYCAAQDIPRTGAEELDGNKYRSYLFTRPGHKGYAQVSEATVKVEIGILKCLYEYLRLHKVVVENPFLRAFQSVRKARAGGRMGHRALSPSQITELLDGGFDRTAAGRRDRMWCELLFLAGIRVSEVVQLRIKDLSSEGGAWRLHLGRTKTGEDEEMIISQTLGSHLKAFVDYRVKEGAKEGEPMFIHLRGNARRGTALSDQYMRRTLKRVSKELGLGPVTCHDGRASFCTAAIASGLSTTDILDMGRWKSISTIMIYNKRHLKGAENPASSFDILTQAKSNKKP